MDYRYIEQLLERYWACETTLQEEAILRQFFAQEDVPTHLLRYCDLFAAHAAMASEHLSDEFDKHMLQLTEKKVTNGKAEEPVRARRIKLSYRMRPLFKAAAVVAMVLSVSLAVQQAMYQEHDDNVVNLPSGVVNAAPSTAYEQTPVTNDKPDSLARLQDTPHMRP